MRLPEKKAYLGAMAAVAVLAMIGALLALVGWYGLGIAFIGVAVALLPIIGHLRMRRELAAFKKIITHPHTTNPDVIDERIQRMEESIRSIADGIGELRTLQEEQGAVTEISKQAQAIRREARMARLLNEATRKGLTG